MYQRKLPWTDARLAPRVLQLPCWRETVHAPVAITVRDEEFASRDKGDAGRHVERLAVQRRLSGAAHAEAPQQGAVSLMFGHRMQTRVGDPDVAAAVDGQAMDETGELSVTPGRHELTFGIEQEDRMRSAAQHIDVAIRGHSALDTRARRPWLVCLAKIPPARQLCPFALKS